MMWNIFITVHWSVCNNNHFVAKVFSIITYRNPPEQWKQKLEPENGKGCSNYYAHILW